MTRPFFSVLAAAVLLAVTAMPTAAQTGPTAVLEQLLAAVNRNDVAAQVAMFTDDAIIIGGPCGSAPCVGKSAIAATLEEGPVQIRFAAPPQVEGNVVRFRLEERFPLPPEVQATGIQRNIENGTAVVNGSKISLLAFVADVTDPQTVALVRLFASFGPEPGHLPREYVARDGQSLVMQPATTQIAFLTTWGEQAHVRWVEDHNAALPAQGR